MVAHTPAPWVIGYDPDDGRPLEILALHRDHRVAFLASNGRAADARLIAAAPDLLAALCSLVGAAEQQAADDGEDDLVAATPEMDTIRAAIAKAQAETP